MIVYVCVSRAEKMCDLTVVFEISRLDGKGGIVNVRLCIQNPIIFPA